MLVIILLALLASFSLAQAQDTNSINGDDAQCPVNIPGITHHGNCNLLCRPASWTDILVFYLVNYVAHAATVTTRPGQSMLTSLFTIAIALLLPGGGVRCGIQAIFNLAKFADTDLQVAARAGALCAVVKIRDALPDPQPDSHAEEGGRAMGGAEGVERQGMRVDPQVLRPKEESRKIVATKIHGLCRLPEGYDLVVVPRTATFERDDQAADLASPFHEHVRRWLTAPFRVEAVPLTVLCCSYNIVKIFVSLAQLGFAIATLYRTRGDQIDLYGYAAFGLTVAPYAWMSFVNLAGNIMCPQYDTMFVVESSSLDCLRAEAEAAGASDSFMVTGTVGRLTVQAEAELMRYYAEVQSRFQAYDSSGAVYAAVVPIAILGGLSRFSPGQSTLYQRVWTMMWLVFGCAAGGAVGQIADHIEGRPVLGSTRHLHQFGFWFIPISIALFYAAAPIGGYIVVGHMIKEFGVCYEFKNVGGAEGL
ncbi:putative pogo transposable element [Dactylonectria estremocensis]|uniref:Pogo transposable element n=1 Tax=Dactylonectria estremocensis TaxID=1079267 RepID=A0A9P9IYL1_9HYPO|nr:putative pogo transposable element [Dactylonectria estremocensis]